MANLTSRPTDRVFQVSLTEIAFTLIFILLLLLGGLLYKNELEKRELRDRLSRAEIASAALKNLEKRIPQIIEQLRQAGAGKPEEVVSALVREAAAREEVRTLQAEVEDLSEKVSALVAVERTVKELGKGDASAKQIVAALVFKKSFEQASRQAVQPGKEEEVGQRLAQLAVDAATNKDGEKSKAEVARENVDLRGQVKFLEGRLNARGGRDYPPCWADEHTGKVQFLFTVDIQEGGVTVAPAWPPIREDDAKALPGIALALSERPLVLNEFNARMDAIFEQSKRKNCRHYVYMKNNVRDLSTFNRYRYGIENMFYKFELR